MQRNSEDTFLPNFCAVPSVFGVVVIAQLFSFVLVLAGIGKQADGWTNLSMVSLFVQWVALSGAATLCPLRKFMARMGNPWAATLSFILWMALTALVSEVAFRLLGGQPLDPGIAREEHLHFLARNLTIAAIVVALTLRYFYVQYQWKRNLEAENQARLEALQARIRPHFLFNSMNAIASLTRSNPELAEQAVEDLAELFRLTIRERGKLVTLGEELNHARTYLNIEKRRLERRLNVEWQIEEHAGDEIELPVLILQPLLENAIYHGIERLPQGGTILITTQTRNKELVITISNPRPLTRQHEPGRGHQMALANVRQRLQGTFGHDVMEIEESQEMFTIRIHLPRSAA